MLTFINTVITQMSNDIAVAHAKLPTAEQKRQLLESAKAQAQLDFDLQMARAERKLILQQIELTSLRCKLLLK